MMFNEMLDLEPNLILADFINLCLMADDDKVRIDIDILDGPCIENLRVIDSRLIPRYEYKIIGIYEAERIVLMIKEDVEDGGCGMISDKLTTDDGEPDGTGGQIFCP